MTAELHTSHDPLQSPLDDYSPNDIVNLDAHQLDPTFIGITGRALSEFEKRTMASSVHAITVEREKRDNPDRFKGSHIVSFGAAVKADVHGDNTTRVFFDPKRGHGVVADGTSVFAAETLARAFSRTLSKRKDPPTTSYDAINGMQKATKTAARILEGAKASLGEEYADDSASLGAVQLLFDRRLAVTHSEDTAVFLYDPTGDCAEVRGYGSPTDPDQNREKVLRLQPGRNIVVLASKGITEGKPGPENAGTEYMMMGTAIRQGMEEALEEASSGLATADETGQIIANRIMENRPNNLDNGSVMAIVIDVDERIDNRGLLRKTLDPLRLSTYLFSALTRARKPGISRRAMYDQPTTRGRLARGLSRGVDVATVAVGAMVAYKVAQPFLPEDLLDMHHIKEEVLGLFSHGHKAAPHTPDSTALPTDPSHNTPPPTAQPSQPATPPAPAPNVETQPTQDTYPDTRTASGYEAATKHASSVSGWSKQALEHYGKEEGLTQRDINDLTSRWGNVEKVNQAFYHNNSDVANDAHHYLTKGDSYNTSGQNDAAHKLISDWKKEHGGVSSQALHAEQQAAPSGLQTHNLDISTTNPIHPPATPSAAPNLQVGASLSPAPSTTSLALGNSYPRTEATASPHIIAASIFMASVVMTAFARRAIRERQRRKLTEAEDSGEARSHSRKKRKLIDGRPAVPTPPRRRPLVQRAV